MDACDKVMDSTNKPRGLIRYASKNMIDNRTKFKITPRILVYTTLLTALLSFCGMLLVLRSDIGVNLLRARGFTYQVRPDGNISNLYTAMITNKSSEVAKIEIECDMGQIVKVEPKSEITGGMKKEWKFFIFIEPEKLSQGRNNITVNFKKDSEIIKSETISFLAPGKGDKK
jgi:polyferredoxin